MNRRTFMTTSACAALAIVGGFVFKTDTGMTDFIVTPANAQDADVDTTKVPDIVQGDANAPVEVIEYASYTCPHCANFHANQYQDLKRDYIDTGKVKFVYREIYFDKFGLWAAMVARCGGDMRYFGIQEMLYSEQREWIGEGNDPMAIVENLRKIGKRAGLTDEDLDACLNDGEMAQAMVAKFEKEVEEYDVNATPTLVIDGEKHSNMNYEELKALIDSALEG